MSDSNSRPRRVRWLVAALAVAGIAVLAWGALAPSQGPAPAGGKPTSEAGDGQAQKLKSLQRRQPGDPYALGRPDAPVVMIQYEDYRCPFCAQFSEKIQPELIDRYVKSGTLRIEWRDMPIFGEQSTEVAEAARAAGQQGRFWQFHDAAYSVGDGNSKPDFGPGVIEDLARRAGVPDMSRFEADRADPAIAAEVARDRDEGQRLGVPSTPAFLIGGQAVLGAQPLPEFVSVIDQERANS